MIRLIASQRFQHTFKTAKDVLEALKLTADKPNSGCFDGEWHAGGKAHTAVNPATNEPIAAYTDATMEQYSGAVQKAHDAKFKWRLTPAPKRGEIVRQMRMALQEQMEPLSHLLTLEMGKGLAEARGEVQEYIDVADYAVGLSRALNGQVIPSERPAQMMLEVWNPLGLTGVISAFNFPVAVYGWNSTLALVTGNSVVWKPAPTGALCAIAVTKILQQVLERNDLPGALCTLTCGGADVGQAISKDSRIDLVSFTGSTAIGKKVGLECQNRFAKSLLELGGNNAIIVCEDADLALALPAIVFASIGTAGQRCTTSRRLIIHESIYDEFTQKLASVYEQIMNRGKIGCPMSSNVIYGPLHSKAAVTQYHAAIKAVKEQGGEIIYGDGTKVPALTASDFNTSQQLKNGNYVVPVITRVDPKLPIVQHETFVPILHTMTFKTFAEAVEINNSVRQGLSSSIFTRNPEYTFKWIQASGSDCGIVNVNIPTNGAEVGGAFGGTKATGWGLESGSDSWKQYMRRQTCTINYSGALPLAQGINFSV